MAISKENRNFVDNLIDYYISEVEAYRQIAEKFIPEVESIPDTAFGIIAGCVYSGFLQAYQTQQQTPDLDDIREFNQILKARSALIKKSIMDSMESKTPEDENPGGGDESAKMAGGGEGMDAPPERHVPE